MFLFRRLLLASRALQLTKAPRRKKRPNVFNDNSRRLNLEHLEDRRLLAVVWANRGSAGSDTDMFGAVYGSMAVAARENIDRAISLWNDVITDFNYDGDNNPATDNVFSLTVIAADLGGGFRGLANNTVTDVNGLPISGTVTMDDAGGNGGWYIDPLPSDNSEFFSIVNPFQADSTQTGNDFLRTVLHEIGHSMGIGSTGSLAINNFLTPAGTDQVSNADNLNVFQNLAGQFGVTVTLTENGGRHIYEGPVDPGFPGAPIHPNELMDPGRTVGPPATRQLVTDLDAMLLADAYGYTVQLPSVLSNSFIEQDAQEENNTLQTAAFLGSDPFVSIQNLSIFDTNDEDFFEIRANQTGKMIIHIDFAHSDIGDLNLEVLDSQGNLIASSESTTDDEEIVIPVVSQEAYFVRVIGVDDNINNYGLEIENFAAPVPSLVRLDPADDNGLFNSDNVTSVVQPRIFIQADLVNFANMGITLLDAAAIDPDSDGFADDATADGAGVYVSLINTATGALVEGFADPIGAVGFLWDFIPESPLSAGLYFVSAAVQMVDGQLPSETGRTELSTPLWLTIELDVPPVSFGQPGGTDGLDPASDTGVVTMPATFADRITSDSTPTFWGLAEAQSTVRLFVDTNNNGVVDGSDVFAGQTTALPFGNNPGFADGFWEMTTIVDLNQPALFSQRDGLRRLLITAEDTAGNVNILNDGENDADQVLEIFLDTQGPQVGGVLITEVPDYNLFDPKPLENGPTPLVRSITIDLIDQPNRVAPDFDYDALKNDIATSPGNYLLVGDRVGTIAIDTIGVTASSAAGGAPATTSITLTFVAPLPDDRFTLTISDNLVDPAGNQLDGESNANEPLEDPTFPSGDGVPGGDFSARFTIDAHPEIGSYVSEGINLDINGNFVWDPANGQNGNDANNVDLTFTLPVANPVDGSIDLGGFSVHDLLFAGKFAPLGGLIVGDDAVFIIDVSGSTDNSFGGDPVGDQNNDGSANTILDAEIAAFKALNQELIDQGLGNTSQVSIVSFERFAASLDMDPVAAGVQLTTTPLADANNNGMRDVDEVLMGLSDGGGTNYENALAEASATVAAIGTPNTNVIFLSDGAPNTLNAHVDEVATLLGQGVNLRAFGVGPSVPLAQLLIIDPNAETFTSTNELLNVFSGGGGVVPGGSISGFDQLAAYGNSAELGEFRWIIDTNSDGVVNPADGDIISLQPLQAGFDVAGAIPLAGNFDGNASNGDEIALYNFGTWVLDTDRDFVIETNGDDTIVVGTLLGHPIIGDFDGDGLDDLAVFNNDVFRFDLANDGFGAADFSGDQDDTFAWGFPGVLDRPVAADMDQDGIDDLGLWVPRNSATLPQGVAEWYFLLSNDFILDDNNGGGNRITGNVNTLDHPFEPVPFGNDLYAEFGDERSLPIVGNFDPPVAEASVPVDPTGQGIVENADFDADGDVDGFDFLAWQRGYGITPPVDEASQNDGDANADGTVDANDLSIWEAGFGSTSVAEAAAASSQSSVAAASQSLASAAFVVEERAQLAVASQVALVQISGLDISSYQPPVHLEATDEVFEDWQFAVNDSNYQKPFWNRLAQRLSESKNKDSAEEEALDSVFGEAGKSEPQGASLGQP